MDKLKKIINKLLKDRSLALEEYEYLISNRNAEVAELLAERATEIRKSIYGDKVFIRGLIEISNICKNDCYYCGIRKSNKECRRYRLTEEEILGCADLGYSLGFRTFVLQGGEDDYFTDDVLCRLIKEVKHRYADCAVTLSLGERSKESYQKLFLAGADRYLLRHETADSEHYGLLHPEELTLENRLECLENLRKAGFQVGCGFMVGSPYQTDMCIAKDLKFIEKFKPDMCGVGPFIPHKNTPFKNFRAGTVELTCYLLSIIRIIHPPVLLPATTALGSIEKGGREKGILSGANVVMPNLSPENARKNYTLYNNKLTIGAESAEGLESLKKQISAVGYKIVTDRGDIRKEEYYGYFF